MKHRNKLVDNRGWICRETETEDKKETKKIDPRIFNILLKCYETQSANKLQNNQTIIDHNIYVLYTLHYIIDSRYKQQQHKSNNNNKIYKWAIKSLEQKPNE